MELFSNLFQDVDARGPAQDAQAELASLRERYDKVVLLSAAMWSLLRDKLALTDEQLATRMAELDASDGQLDGQMRRPPNLCPRCNRKSPARFKSCMYCGSAA